MTVELNTERPEIQDDETVETTAEDELAGADSSAVLVISRATLNYFLIAGVFLALGIVIGLAVDSGGRSSDLTLDMVSTAVVQALNSPVVARAAPTPGPAPFVNVSVDDDPAWGPEDAPVVMVEFSDFQCPFCQRFHQQTYSRLQETYGDKIRFVYRDMPLPEIHPDAIRAAQAAECADDQGAFWNYHDLLFNNQRDLSRTALSDYAARLELDISVFDHCLDNGRYEQEVSSDMQDAATYGVRGTPTFFINGRPIVGAQPFEVFAALIDEELAKATTGT